MVRLLHTSFSVLGPVRARCDGQDLSLGPPKQRALLALLLIQANQPVPLHEIVDVLWGPEPPGSAVNVVQRHIGTLRRLVEPGLPARGRSRWLVRDSGGYRLKITDLDLLSFRDLRQQAEEAARGGDIRRAVDTLCAALELWRGPVASGIAPEVRVHPVFAAVDGEYLAAVKDAADLTLGTASDVKTGLEGTAGPERVSGPGTVPEPRAVYGPTGSAWDAWARAARARVLPPLRQAAVRHPFDEALQARLMLLLSATGHQADALTLYRDVHTRLTEELGVRPGPELRDAQRQVLADRADTDDDRARRPVPVPRTPVQRRVGTDTARTTNTRREACVADRPDTGEPPEAITRPRASDGPRIAAATTSETAHDGGVTGAVTTEDATDAGPTPIATADTRPDVGTQPLPDPVPARPAQLPADLPAFTGRRRELAALRELLPSTDQTASAVVIGAIGGTAGVGKTSLAVHWARSVADRFPDGQLYLNLRGFHPSGSVMSPTEALRSFLSALGVPASRIPADLDAQAALYRSVLAQRRMLIVLDNARDSEQVRPLLPGAPGSLVLVTSRSQLYGLIAVEGAHPVTLDLPNQTEALELLSQRLGTRRVATEPIAAAEIVASCGRLPLALAIVSARAAVNPRFPLAAVAAELRASAEGLDAFTGEAPVADARSAFSWSYRLLTPEAARMFRLISLHPGPSCSLRAAAALAGKSPGEVQPLLGELVRAQLLAESGPGRYGCHELLRSYGGELGRAEDARSETAAATRRMLDHYLLGAHAADQLLKPSAERFEPTAPASDTVPAGFADQTGAVEWLEANLPVLLAVVAQDARHGSGEHGWQLAAAIESYLDRGGRWQEQVATQSAALDAAHRLGDVRGQAHAYRALGFGEGRLGRWTESDGHLARALELFGEIGDLAGQGRVHRYVAFLANRRGRHDEALEHYERACSFYHAAGRPSGEASVANEIGWTYILTGRYEEALRACERSLKVHRRLGDRNGEAAAWDSIGYAHHHLHAHQRALSCYARALALYRDIRDRYLEADTLVHIGDTHRASGDEARARETWMQALDVLEDIAHPDAERVRIRLRRVPVAAGP